MLVVGHTTTWVDGFPVMEFDMAGTTGNLYKVTVGKVPVCNCPDGRKGNQCKHIFYGILLITTTTILIPIYLTLWPIKS